MDSNGIFLFPPQATAFDRGGTRLHPLSCVITEEAAGDWRLDMTLPRDDAGLTHRLIRCGSLITAPVPDRHIPLMHLYPPGEQTEIYRVNPQPVPTAAGGAVSMTYPDAPLYGEKDCLTVIAHVPVDTELRLLEPPAEGDTALHLMDETGRNGYKPEALLAFAEQRTGGLFRDGTCGPRQPFRVERLEYEDGQFVHVSARHISFDAAAVPFTGEEQRIEAEDMPLWQFCGQMTALNGRVTFLAGAEISVSGVYGEGENALQAVTEMAQDHGLILIRDERRVYLMESAAADRVFTLHWGRDLTSLRLTRDSSEMISAFIPVIGGEAREPVFSPLAEDGEHWPPVQCLVKADTAQEAEALIRQRMVWGWDRPETGIELRCVPQAVQNIGLYDTVQVREPLTDTLYTGRVTRLEWNCLTRRVTGIGIGRGGAAPGMSIFIPEGSVSETVTEQGAV